MSDKKRIEALSNQPGNFCERCITLPDSVEDDCGRFEAYISRGCVFGVKNDDGAVTLTVVQGAMTMSIVGVSQKTLLDLAQFIRDTMREYKELDS
jgi:hypothetical protein